MDNDEILQALANLQLPHMPSKTLQEGDTDNNDNLPSIRILVVADLDLPSAAALAEYVLQQRNSTTTDNASDQQQQRPQPLDASRIDLCIACGPFCRDEDLQPYLTGKQRFPKRQHHYSQQHQQQHQQQQQPFLPSHLNHNNSFNSSLNNFNNSTSSFNNFNNNNNSFSSLNAAATAGNAKSFARPDHSSSFPIPETPFSRSKEETSGLEGLLTAALSQLEGIVCRVVYCPGASDPITSMVSLQSTSSSTTRRKSSTTLKRLTPNSRNIHKQWLPLAPALGCAGLLYLDSTYAVRRQAGAHRKSNRRRSVDSSDDDEGGGGGGGGAGFEDDMELLTEKLMEAQKSSDGYLATLSRLLKLAPPSRNPLPFVRKQSQTILVTHYVDCYTDCLDQEDKDDDEFYHLEQQEQYERQQQQEQHQPANGSPSWALESHLPWPHGHGHEDFMYSKTAQQLLCLEIASGSSVHRQQSVQQRGDVNVLFPGSLRARGEFAIVDLTVTKAATTTSATAAAASTKKSSKSGNHKTTHNGNHDTKEADVVQQYVWSVTNVDFHNIR